MTIKEYVESLKNIENSQEDKNYYISFFTEFEKIKIYYDETKLFPSMSNLIRFINPEYYDFFDDEEKLRSIHFLPSHIETIINESLLDDIIDPICNPYLPTDMQCDLKVGEYKKSIIKASERALKSTSLYTFINMTDEDIYKVIEDLKREIISVRDYDVAFGHIPEYYGILERSNNPKTNDPESRHCNFWKFSDEPSFSDVSQKFDIVK